MSEPNDDDPLASPGLGRGVTLAMAAACGVAVANIYYNQPLLGIIERDFPGHEAVVGFVPTATQIGYAVGVFLLVPLGDKFDRRKLILVQLACMILALLGAALAPNAWMLVGASVAVGLTAPVAQQIIPFAAELATPSRRGSTIGTVMSGLLCGILFGRTLAGFVGHLYGWRVMFVVGIGMAAGVGLMLAAILPSVKPKSHMSYAALLGSLVDLLRDEPELRRSAAIQTFLFGSFSVFWTILALRLEQPPFHMGANIAGLFGLVGAAGILIAPLAGRVADRRGPQAGMALGIVLMLACWVVFGLWASVPGLVVGVILLDVGEQGTLIFNQHVVFALNPEARNRINTVLVGGMFIGGAIGSAGATLCWNVGGWPPVCWFGGSLVGIALLVHLLSRKPAIARTS